MQKSQLHIKISSFKGIYFTRINFLRKRGGKLGRSVQSSKYKHTFSNDMMSFMQISNFKLVLFFACKNIFSTNYKTFTVTHTQL